MKEWLAASGITSGPIFRPINRGGRASVAVLSADSVPDIVKAQCLRTGRDPTLFAAHSLWSGFLTSGAEAEPSVFKLMEVSRHKSVDTLRGYVPRADLFKDHAGAAFL